MTENKQQGDIGFRDISYFNKALLAKHIWRLILNSNLLVSKELKAKYFTKQNLLES